MRAIESQELLATRDNRNHWKITAQAVEEWALAQCAPSEQVPSSAQVEKQSAHYSFASQSKLNELTAEREARRLAEVEAAELKGKLVATEAERDRLHEIVKSLTASQVKRKSWWPF